MTAAVELVGARKTFGSVEALRGVDIAIEPGEVVAILGPNGAGKTTSIGLMLGLRKPTAGTARLFGMDPSDRHARSRTGVMLQESGVPGALKVREVVDLFSCYYPDPLPPGEAIRLAGLEEKADQGVDKLSGGQRQRLYFALAVCGDPDLIFFDEPTVGMDVESRRAFLSTIKRLGEAGKTIVLTTHYLEEADQLAKRIVVIDRGHIIADATPREIKSRVAGKRIRFTSRGVAGSALHGLPVSSVDIDGDRVTLLSNQPEAILRELFRREVPISELEVAGADLEEAFITLTSHPGKEEAP